MAAFDVAGEPERFVAPPDIGPTERTYPGAQRPDRSFWVRSAGLHIATYEWGDPDGPIILMAHGGFDFAGTFDVFAPMLAAEGYRVVRGMHVATATASTLSSTAGRATYATPSRC